MEILTNPRTGKNSILLILSNEAHATVLKLLQAGVSAASVVIPDVGKQLEPISRQFTTTGVSKREVYVKELIDEIEQQDSTPTEEVPAYLNGREWSGL